MRKITKYDYYFGITSFGKDAVLGFVSTFLAYYFTDILVLSPLFVGLLLFVARIWDAVNDPIMGIVIDNTSSKYGKFKKWLTIGVFTNFGVFILLFNTFGLSGISLLIYVSVVYVLFDLTYTMLDVAYWAWLPNLADNLETRNRVLVIPRIFASLAALVIAAGGLPFINFLGQGNEEAGFPLMVIIVANVFVMTSLPTVLKVRDNSADQSEAKNPKIALKDTFNIIQTNKQFRAFILFYLAFNLGIQIFNGFTLYYFKYVIKNELFFSIFVFTILFEMLGIFLFPKVAIILGRRRTFSLACGLTVSGLLAILLVGLLIPDNIVAVFVAGMVMKLGTGLEVGVTSVAIAEVIDYGEARSGERHESIFYSFQSFAVKVAWAFSGFLVGVGLDLIGYLPGGKQTIEAQNNIRVLTCIVPIVFVICSYVIYRRKYEIGDVK